jgi:hypothetical protein
MKKCAIKVCAADIHDLERQLRAAKKRIRDLEESIGSASVTLYDWDGYFDEKTMKGNAAKLAALIEDAYVILQGRRWRGKGAGRRHFRPSLQLRKGQEAEGRKGQEAGQVRQSK